MSPWNVGAVGLLLLGCSAENPGTPLHSAPERRSDDDAAPVKPVAGCPAAIGFDEPTSYRLSAHQALDALHAKGQRFVLIEDHGGFFDKAGLGPPGLGGDEVVFSFAPSPTEALTYAQCSKGGSDTAFALPGIMRAKLSRGVVLQAPGEMQIGVSRGAVTVGEFSGFVEGTARRLQIIVQLGQDAQRVPMAILHAGRGNSLWRPAPEKSADAAAASGPLSDFGRAAAGLSGQEVHCKTDWRPTPDFRRKPGDPEPPSMDPAPPPAFTTTGPTVSVAEIGVGRMSVDVLWPGDTSPVRFSLPVHLALANTTIRGYRLFGDGSEDTPLPAGLTKWAGCAERQDWWLFLQAISDASGKPVARMGMTWGPGCNRLVTCGVQTRSH